ncbi:putative ABC transporter ATP-binding protein YbhF [Paraliobacillus sp. PM-2]|uniref:ABC transporter ATP-binding protein n=1 Tax=Paraliobacillus sp. PM-2 TaxID=1462524 RepID=UPI00061BAF66|nr:ABC transporter ATP-binding protein [Paraliobacillus sp. PM-2]CQR48314.1 putative ABC transporter ATP-binding protein YbhF [Paraliobacillus sp. PM-2]
MCSIIHLDQVNQAYGKEVVLKDIQLEINKGEIYGLLGPSGSGKTTLVKTIIGAITPKSGLIEVEGVKMPNLNKLNDIGYMAQADALYDELTANENLAFFAKLYRMQGSYRKRRITEVLKQVDLLADKEKRVEHFSGGMKRRLSLAIALLHEPKLLILDEPTVGIDPVLRNQIWDSFYQLKEAGVTVIITTHVMDEAEKCDRLGLLRNGHILASDTPISLKQRTNTATIEEAFLQLGDVQ